MRPFKSIWFERNFDRDADFVALKKFRTSDAGGEKDWRPGEAIDKTRFTTRLLRLLYEQRYLGFAKGDAPGAPPGRPLRLVKESVREFLGPPPSIKLEVRQTGRGQVSWAVFRDGERVTELMTRLNAEQEKRRMSP